MNRARGFTLIEILVALIMFAVVGGTLLQLFELGLRTTRSASERTHAVLLARSKLTELLSATTSQPDSMSGDFDDGYRWRADFSPVDSDDDDDALGLPESDFEALRIDLIVTWGDNGEQQTFRLESLMLAPPQTDD